MLRWNFLSYTQCDTFCGLGSQTRPVVCQRLDGSQVDDQYCITQAKPATERGCENNECPIWVKTAWTKVRRQGKPRGFVYDNHVSTMDVRLALLLSSMIVFSQLRWWHPRENYRMFLQWWQSIRKLWSRHKASRWGRNLQHSTLLQWRVSLELLWTHQKLELLFSSILYHKLLQVLQQLVFLVCFLFHNLW